jgi:hypothetical protein
MRDVTPGGAAQGILGLSYYRDNSCFDDGTGTDPGPKVYLRSGNEPTTWGRDPITNIASAPAPVGADPVYQRTCWTATDGVPDPNFSPQGDVRYFQGDIATHGLHLMFVGESDNAYQTVPLTEIDSVQRMTVRPGCSGGGAACNVGETYGRSTEFPLRATATPLAT